MFPTSNRRALLLTGLLPLIILAIGCGQPTKRANDGIAQESASEAPKEWNAIDDITIYYWCRSDKPKIPEQDYDKQMLIDALRKLAWSGRANAPPPPIAPIWQVTAKAKGNVLFQIFVPDNEHFFVTDGDPFENGRYADPGNCWSTLREQLKVSNSEFANPP